MSTLSTHVLDVSLGHPAAAVPVTLEARQPDGGFRELGRASTDSDGRVRDRFPELEPGVYRLSFDTATYFAGRGVRGFYPSIAVAFEVTSAGEHYHVPLLLSPFGYSTYRGS